MFKNFSKLVLGILLFIQSPMYAGTSLSFIYGDRYKLEDPQQWRLRLDHFSQFKYGDNAIFFRANNPDKDGTAMYGEYQPRLSFSKILHRDISYHSLSDILIASQVNFSGTGLRAYLLGLGFDFDLPYFKVFKFNIYQRNNPNLKGKTFQLTPIWSIPFSIHHINFSYSGFIDYIGSEGNLKPNLLSRSQLLVDLGELTHKTPKTLYLGPRLTYWRHKLGISGVHEKVIEFMLQWRLD